MNLPRLLDALEQEDTTLMEHAKREFAVSALPARG